MNHFNHTVIFFNLVDSYRINDIYISHTIGHTLITKLLQNLFTRGIMVKWSNSYVFKRRYKITILSVKSHENNISKKKNIKTKRK